MEKKSAVWIAWVLMLVALIMEGQAAAPQSLRANLNSETKSISQHHQLSQHNIRKPLPHEPHVAHQNVNVTVTWEMAVEQFRQHRSAAATHHHPLLNSTKCTAHNFRYGQWVHGAHHCGLTSVYKNGLRESGHFNDMIPPPQPHLTQEPYPFADWCWKPNDCIAEPFSIPKFCEKLAGRSILVVGDSLSHEFYVALASQLETPVNEIQGQGGHPSVNGPKGLICQKSHPGTTSRLGFLRNDHLAVANINSYTLQPWAWDSHGHMFDRRDWKAAALDHFEIVLLNKGAHQEIPWEEHVFFTETTAQFLHDFLFDPKQIQKQGNSTSERHQRRVLFRTAVQGKPHASVFLPVNQTKFERGMLPILFPENSPQLTEKEKHTYYDGYHWDRIPIMNFFVENTFKHKLPPPPLFDIMYTEEMSSLRPDTHRCSITNLPELEKPRLAHLLQMQQIASTISTNDSTVTESAVFKAVRELVRSGTLHESCDELHHYLPSDIDNYVFMLHNLLY
jgi:hypothetical protein